MIALLLACTGADRGGHPNQGDGPAPHDPTAGTPTQPSSSWTLPVTEPPAFDAEALGEGLDLALGQVLELSALPVLAAYDEVMGYRGAYCPYTYGYQTYYYGGYSENWYAQCESPAGATFSGYAGDYQSEGYTVDAGYRGLYASATVVLPDDTALSAAGYWAHSRADYGTEVYTYEYLDGTFTYDAAADGTWIASDVQPHELEISTGGAVSGAWSYVSVNGQFTGIDGPIDTVDFGDATLQTAYDCDEPSGTIAVRTTDTDWFDITFSGDPADPGGCDGCGRAFWRGLEQGEVCGDFTQWQGVL
jgi:hypothetical protein